MGSQRPAERLVRCDSIGFSLRRLRSTPHNIGGLPPYSDLGQKLEPVDVVILNISPKGIFDRPVSRSLCSWPNYNGEQMWAGSLLGLDRAFVSPHNQLLPIRHEL
jgi:hypothetical protein